MDTDRPIRTRISTRATQHARVVLIALVAMTIALLAAATAGVGAQSPDAAAPRPTGPQRPLERHVMPEPNTDGVGTWPVHVVVTAPLGWSPASSLRGGGLWLPDQTPDRIARLVIGRPGSLEAGSDGPDPTQMPTGRTIDDLVSILSTIPGVETSDIAIDGYEGKRVGFTIPEGSESRRGPSGWFTPSGGESWGYGWEPGWHYDLSILDIDGVPFLIDAGYRVDAPPEALADVRSMIDSVELLPGRLDHT